MTMTIPSMMFGTELRRQRLEAGLSLADLAKLVHYSKSHLSKVETGSKPASTDLARQCDAVLESAGTLVRLAPQSHADTSVQADNEAGEVWIVKLDANGDNTFGAVSRRSLLVAGAATMAAWVAAPPGSRPPGNRAAAGDLAMRAAEPTVTSFRVIFDNLRQLGQWVRPNLLIPQLATQVHALRTLAGQVRAGEGDAAMVLAARFAEYAGWLTQESGDDAGAVWWTDRAVELAAAGGDMEMQAYAMVRRGLIALYQHDAVGTVGLARAAQEATHDARIQGLAAQREAQGHALAGDYDACMRAIDRAASRLSVAPESAAPVIGTSQVTDVTAMATGWCLFDLGRPADAATILARELGRIPTQALRAQARYGARLALAYAASGEPEAACVAVSPVLDAIDQIESATVRSELRALARTLNRWHAEPAIRDTRLRLTNSLNTGVYSA